jgi:nuclear transport factor 2 (NTF2) superfamily protein
MSDTETTIKTFVASWNEPNADARREVIEQIWAPDGVYRNASSEFRGRDGIADAVSAAYETFTQNGFRFDLAAIDVNHNAVRYRWEMVPVGGGEPDSIGTHVAMVGADGRLVSDHQFIDQPPTPR